MGFLDHSTNNIIIDAVLTDKGRELLAKNNGSFRIMHYAFGDDEVDYTLIKKFGRTVGKEKIEKNTPVFEAQTSSTLSLKYPLTTISDPTIVALPILALQGTVANITQTSSQLINIEQQVQSSNLLDSQRAALGESNYQVSIDSRFLGIAGSSTFRTIPNSNTRVYDLSAVSTSSTSDVLSKLGFTLQQASQGKTLTRFHTTSTSGTVKTIVRIVGVSTGISLNIEVTVQY